MSLVTPVYSILWDSFQLVEPDNVDKIIYSVRPSACLLDSSSAWLIRSARVLLAK